MNTYLILIRGINVGGKSKVPMADLRKSLEDLGFSKVTTYIASGNVILESDKSASDVGDLVGKALVANFKLDSEIANKVLVLTPSQLQAVVRKKPKGFGEQPGKYHSDVVFLIDIKTADAMSVFNPREGVDKVWPGGGVIYSQRLSAERTKSRLSKIIGTPAYKSMTIRTWGTISKLLDMLQKTDT